MPSLRRQCLARFYRYLMAGFEVTINGRFWVTAEVMWFLENCRLRTTFRLAYLGIEALFLD